MFRRFIFCPFAAHLSSFSAPQRERQNSAHPGFVKGPHNTLKENRILTYPAQRKNSYARACH